MPLSFNGIDKIFSPSGVAIIGPALNRSDIASILHANLLAGGYKGKLALIDTSKGTDPQAEVSAVLKSADFGFDLAMFAGPWPDARAVIQACGKSGVGAVVMLSKPPQDFTDEAAIRETAQTANVRLVGPGSWGVINSAKGLVAALAAKIPAKGEVAVLSQSGAMCALAIETSLRKKMGIGLVLDVGSEWDVTLAEVLDFLSIDYRAKVILLHFADIKNPRALMSSARAASRVKPLLALYAGLGLDRPSQGTDLLAASAEEIHDAFFLRAGVLRTDTMEDSFDVSVLLLRWRQTPGSRLKVLTNAASAGQIAAASFRRWGVGSPYRSLPATELPADAAPEDWRRAFETCLADPEVDAVLTLMFPWPGADLTDIARQLGEAYGQSLKAGKKTLFLSACLGGDENPACGVLPKYQVTMFGTTDKAIMAFAQVSHHEKTLKNLQEIPRRTLGELVVQQDKARAIVEGALAQGRSSLFCTERAELLQAYGLPVLPCKPVDSSEAIFEAYLNWDFPVKVKAVARELRNEHNLHDLSLESGDPGEVKRLWPQIKTKARKQGMEVLEVVAQPVLPSYNAALWLGVRRHHKFGPLLLFGQGGSVPEHLREKVWGLPPMNRQLARMLLQTSKIFHTVTANAPRPAVNPSIMEELLIRLAQLAMDFPQLELMDLNPVIISDGMTLASDINVSLTPSGIKPPLHLAVSPYPNQYESAVQTEGGLKTFLRPIKPEDGPMLKDFFAILSPDTIFKRFFHPVSKLTHEMIVRFTQIDYDREIAILALEPDGLNQTMMGVGRMGNCTTPGMAEFSLVVGDPWQGRGLGKLLLGKLIEIAKERRIECLLGLSLKKNRVMVELGRKLGFTVEMFPGDDVALRLKLD